MAAVIGSGAATFFMEAWFPMGDWRWAVIAAVCFLITWWLLRGEESEEPPRASADLAGKSWIGEITAGNKEALAEQLADVARIVAGLFSLLVLLVGLLALFFTVRSLFEWIH